MKRWLRRLTRLTSLSPSIDSLGIEVYFENSAYEEFGSEPTSVESSKKNWDGSSNLGYMYLRMDH